MRLSTRLSLSYIGFLALLAALVIGLATIQINRLAKTAATMPTPASPGDAQRLAGHLATNGLTAPLPADALADTLNAGGWAQVIDAEGREVEEVAAPSDRSVAYSAPQLVAMTDPWGDRSHPWYYELAPIPGDLGLVILAVPREQVTPLVTGRLTPAIVAAFWRHFVTGLGLAVLTAVALALLAGFWYARRLTRPLTRLSAELRAAAAGDFSRRLPVRGKDEFAVLAQAFNNLTDRLGATQRERDRLEQARRDLVANISHDLRTPLTAIQGFAESMARPEASPEERSRHASLIADRVRSLDALLGDLLELSRLQALPELNRTPVDLPELLREQVIALIPLAEEAGAEVEVDLPDAMGPVPVDARLISRAVANLLANALRHSGGATRIRIAAGLSGEGVAIVVSDNGRGIPAADLPHLFERYYQGRSGRPGLGLGLAIVRQIMDGHGGKVTVDTAEGRGTTFTLWLPV